MRRVVQRCAFAASALVVIACAPSPDAITASLGEPWTTTSFAPNARGHAASTRLASGKVLVVSGFGEKGSYSTAEIFDPTTEKWSSGGSFATARAAGALTLLGSGVVLFSGGVAGSFGLGDVDAYDPIKGTWTSAGTLATPRYGHTATQISTGKVLVAGGDGSDGYVTSAVELFDPSTGKSSSAAPLATKRVAHTATKLADGRVLVVGGIGSDALSSAELYDATSGTWTSAGAMANARYGHAATLLESGRVLVVGGSDSSGGLSTAETFDPISGTFSALAAMSVPRVYASATRLLGGRVLVVGGDRISGFTSAGPWNTAEIYDPKTANWTSATSLLARARKGHTATLLAGGRVLVTHGLGAVPPPAAGDEPLSTAEIYADWTDCTSASACSSGHCVDSVCCDRACDGQCEACDVDGSKGTCTGVVGAPHGSRPACADGGPDVCRALACNGAKDSTKCTYVNGSKTSCGAGSCVGDVLHPPPTCDGAGACVTTAPESTCAPYGCLPTGCRTRCSTNAECAAGFACSSGTCVAAGLTICSADGLSSIGKDGTTTSCAPYRCGKSGECVTHCTVSTDCVTGLVCDGESCVPPREPTASPTTNNGGCSMSQQTSTGGLSMLATIVVLLGARLRRRTLRLASTVSVLAALVLAIGCAVSDVAPPKESATAPSASAIVRSLRTFRGFESVGSQSKWSQGVGLDVKVPATSNGPLTVARRTDLEFRLEISAKAASTARGVPVDGAVVFADALSDTDIVHASGADGVEELRLLRSSRAPTRWEYEIRLGASVSSVRVRDGRVEALDEAGTPGIVSSETFAVDARGVRRDVSLRLRSDGARQYTLVAELVTEGLSLPIAVDPTWTSAGTMTVARDTHEAVVLPSGKAMVVGGTSSSTPTADVFDPKLKTWKKAASMAEGRQAFAALALSTKKIIAIGGIGSSALSTTELYDETTDTWKSGASMASGRYVHAAVVLSDGRVLAMGGKGGGTTAEIYDPAADSWSSAGNLAEARQVPRASLLASGKVIVTGGYSPTASSTAELFDPTSKTWTAAAAMKEARGYHTATVLASGKVLVVGGPSSTAELYDPAADTWTYTGSMSDARTAHAAVLVGGKVMVTGGYATPGTSLSTAEVYDPATGTWSKIDSMATARRNHTATALPGDRVLVAGGLPSTSSAELYDPLLADGSACTAGTECSSTNCADGVCCNVSCAGQCEACDVTGSKGTCTPITGAPHGSRPKCSDGAGDVCKAAACDGKTIATCAAMTAATVECKAASCAGASFTDASKCDGAGGCSPGATKSCAPFGCAVTGCRTSCATATDCADGFDCTGGICVSGKPTGPRCTTDGTASIGTDGKEVPCSPYKCRTVEGMCATTCLVDGDCAGGLVCRANLCGAPPPPATSDDGGCSVSIGVHENLSGSVALIGLAALSFLARRRRRA